MINTGAMPTTQTAITGVSQRIPAGQEIRTRECRDPDLPRVPDSGVGQDLLTLAVLRRPGDGDQLPRHGAGHRHRQGTDAGDVDVQFIRRSGSAGAERTAAVMSTEQLGEPLPWIHPSTVAAGLSLAGDAGLTPTMCEHFPRQLTGPPSFAGKGQRFTLTRSSRSPAGLG